MDTVGDLTSRRKSQENNALSTSLSLHSVSGTANSEGGGPRRESRSWAGGSRIDDFFAAAMTKGMKVVLQPHSFKTLNLLWYTTPLLFPPTQL